MDARRNRNDGCQSRNPTARGVNLESWDPLCGLRSTDLERLLNCPAELLLGAIMRLNGDVRYHNSLNTVELTNVLLELRKETRKIKDRVLLAIPVPSVPFPDSSGSTLEEQ
jgi:hypothetical protein